MRPALLAFLIAASAATSTLPAQGSGRPLANGDRILMKFWMDTVFVDSVRVQDGRITLPRLGSLPIAGLPANAVADSIRRVFGAIFQPVAIEITPLRRVVVMGEVRMPRVYFFEDHTTFREAIAAAGGIPESGRTGRITLYRDSVRTPVRDWRERFDPGVVVHSGDVIIVDRENWVKRNAFTVVSGVSVLLSIVITLTNQ